MLCVYFRKMACNVYPCGAEMENVRSKRVRSPAVLADYRRSQPFKHVVCDLRQHQKRIFEGAAARKREPILDEMNSLKSEHIIRATIKSLPSALKSRQFMSMPQLIFFRCIPPWQAFGTYSCRQRRKALPWERPTFSYSFRPVFLHLHCRQCSI